MNDSKEEEERCPATLGLLVCKMTSGPTPSQFYSLTLTTVLATVFNLLMILVISFFLMPRIDAVLISAEERQAIIAKNQEMLLQNSRLMNEIQENLKDLETKLTKVKSKI